VTRRFLLPVFSLYLALLLIQGFWGIYSLHKLREISLVSLARGVLSEKHALSLYENPVLYRRKLKDLPEGELFLGEDPQRNQPLLLLVQNGKTFHLSSLAEIPKELAREVPAFLFIQGVILLFFLASLFWIYRELKGIEEVVKTPQDIKGFGLKALSQALRLTLESLESARRKAERLAEERGQALEELRKTQEQLLKNERLATLGYFSGGVVHEIGNPLSGALQYLEAIRGLEGTEKKAIEPWLDRIHNELQRIEKTLIALRSLARPDEIQLRKTDLIPLILRLRERIEKESLNHPTITLDLGESMEVETDPHLLEVLLRNLLHNSLKVQGENPYVEIKAGIQQGRPTIEIGDRGPGFPPDFDPDQLFTSRQGMGFGIPLSLRIAELLGIELIFRSDPEGGRVILRWLKERA
jgi:signal transduction histidine kinase